MEEHGQSCLKRILRGGNFEQNEEKTKFKVILSYVYLFLLSKKAWFSVPFYQSKRNRPMQGQGI